MIEVKGLTKRFGAALAVERLDFSAAQGEILGFLGPNGAGKTTTLRILTGYFPPNEGTVLVNGCDVLEEPMAARRSVGYLPESVPLYQDMRVGEYLRFVGGAKGLNKPQTKREADRVMEATGTRKRAGQLIKQLSKGYRQRVGLAQALLGDPPVLILDEPTIGLDPGQIVEIRSLIKGFAGKKTVVLSSHILPEVAAVCSRVVIINHGRLAAQGSPAMLETGLAGGQRLRLVCLGPARETAELLQGIKGVAALTPAEPPEGAGELCAFDLETVGGAQTQAALARAVVEAGRGLVELTPTARSLEEVFVSLTANEDNPGGAAS